MKCSICNTENPSDATACQQCGFSLSLSQPAWPDFPTVEIPEPAAFPEWPELPEVKTESLPAIPEPAWHEIQGDTPAISTKDVEPEAKLEAEVETQVETETEPVALLPSSYPSDDALARTHVARGFEAIREGLIDQARWEFEQARDLADSTDISRLAQAQLGELLPREPASLMPERVRPIRRPSPRPTLDQVRATDWKPTLRIGATLGVINGVCTGCTAVFCLGFVLSPFLGFITGLLVARSHSDTAAQPVGIIHAIAAGGITGLGGWLGQAVSYPVWTTSIFDTLDIQNDATTLVCITFLGMLYIPMTIALSALGWGMGTPNRSTDR